jgi:hypothetical protein
MPIRNMQEHIDKIAREYLDDPPGGTQEDANGNGDGGTRGRWEHAEGKFSDEEVLELCRRAKNSPKFEALFDRGDLSGNGGDHNRADKALIRLLSFYTQDAEQIDRLFRRSALNRDKWERREDYRRRTIRKILDDLGEVYDGPGPSAKSQEGSQEGSQERSQDESSDESANGRPPGTVSARDLMSREFRPVRWIIPDILPTGVTLLAGKPKKGKSWMALGMCESVASGGVAFGRSEYNVQEGETLYLGLEDNERRLQNRLKTVLDGRDAPEGMHVGTEWPRIDEGGAEQLDEWLTERPDARLVVVDTLSMFRKPASGKNIYQEDYAAVRDLLPMAAKHDVAIVVVYHLRKAPGADPIDEINSSTGLTAGVDGFLILRRSPGGKGPTLFVEGRDITDPKEYALIWNQNTASWTIEGDAQEVHLSRLKGLILLMINRAGEPQSPKEVADAISGSTPGSIKVTMSGMWHDALLEKTSKGKYYPPNPTNPEFKEPEEKKV